jgi:magnesium-dependent phosphatase 1
VDTRDARAIGSTNQTRVRTPHPSSDDVGTVGMKVRGGQTVMLFPGARTVLYEIATNPSFEHVQLAVASSSLEPSYSRMCLDGLEILLGRTMRDMIQYDEIGRTGHLSADKRRHFRHLHRASGVPYHEMLFFDDCNWGDHCGVVTREFGVVSQPTPAGLTVRDFEQGLQRYEVEAAKRATGL